MGASKASMTEVSAAKKELRQLMRERRATMSPIAAAAASAEICLRVERLVKQWELSPLQGPAALYFAIAGEPNVDLLINQLWLEKWQIIVPHLYTSLERPGFALVTEDSTLTSGYKGIRTPRPDDAVVLHGLEDATCVVLPGLAFDRTGGRLGQGGGWYDRALRGARHRIGVCFDYQLVEQVPCEPHDQRVSAIVTETETIIVAR